MLPRSLVAFLDLRHGRYLFNEDSFMLWTIDRETDKCADLQSHSFAVDECNVRANIPPSPQVLQPVIHAGDR